jgi:ParB/RepB/Spo0J family partition protein
MARNSTGGKAAKFDAKAQASGAVDKLFGARQGEQVVSGLKLVRHEHITVKPQPRTRFSNIEVAELAGSIAQLHERGEGIEGTGILQPLLVTLLKDPDPENPDARYRLIAGERRFRASQEAGLPHVPCLVLSLSEQGVLPAQLIENLQRQNLAPLDEARALEQLRDEQGLSVRDLAKSLGKTRGYVTNRLDLLKMGEDVQAMVSSREDTLKHAALIDAVPDEETRRELIRAVTEEGASVKEIERRITGDDTASTPPGSSTPVSSREDTSTGSGSAGGSSRSIRETPPQPPDPIISALRPAAAFVAEAARQIEELRLTADYKRQLREAVQGIKEQLNKIEKAAK